MIRRADVELAYRVFLHREPESEEVVLAYMHMASIELLLKAFISSDEFRIRLGHAQTPLDWPALCIESRGSPEQESALLDHVRATWRQLGETAPHWSVLSTPQFRPEHIDANRENFSATGRFEVDILRQFLARSGLDPADFHTCFELGCGVGRVTRWLAELFPAIIAGDVSQTHLDILRGENLGAHVRPLLLEGPAAIDELPDVDIFFSLITLQHNPPPMIRLWLQACLARLRPGGLGYYQLPTYSKAYSFNLDVYLSALPSAGEMEMHILPQPEVFGIIAQSCCDVLEVREDDHTGDTRGLSNVFFVRKRAA